MVGQFIKLFEELCNFGIFTEVLKLHTILLISRYKHITKTYCLSSYPTPNRGRVYLLVVTPAVAGLNTNIPCMESAKEETPVISGEPVVPAGLIIWDTTCKAPSILSALKDQGAPVLVWVESPLTSQTARAKALSVAVVTAGAFGDVSPSRYVKAPVPVSKSTSSGVVKSTPVKEPIQ